MSLTLLLGMVVVGLAAVVVAVHYTGGSRPARLADEDAARRRFADDFPDLAVRSVLLTEDRDAAFLDLEDQVGVVQSFGDKFLARVVTAADLAAQPVVSDRSLKLRFDDFTWKGGEYTFDAEAAAAAVKAMFETGAPTRIREER